MIFTGKSPKHVAESYFSYQKGAASMDSLSFGSFILFGIAFVIGPMPLPY